MQHFFLVQYVVYWTWSPSLLIGEKKLLPDSSQADPWKGQGSGSIPKGVESFCEWEIIVDFCICIEVGSLNNLPRVTKQQSGRTETDMWHPDSYLSLVSILSFTDAFKSLVNIAVMHLEMNTNKYFFLVGNKDELILHSCKILLCIKASLFYNSY